MSQFLSFRTVEPRASKRTKMPDYQKKTVAELTEILKGRSLPHSGKKAELIARLNEADKAAAPSEGMHKMPCHYRSTVPSMDLPELDLLSH